MRPQKTTELGKHVLKSGRTLSWSHDQDLESDAHVFSCVSEANGRRYAVRIPLVAISELTKALKLFERRIRNGS